MLGVAERGGFLEENMVELNLERKGRQRWAGREHALQYGQRPRRNSNSIWLLRVWVWLLFASYCLLVNIQGPSFKRMWLCTVWFWSISIQFSPGWDGDMCVRVSVHVKMPSALDSVCFQRDLEIVQSFLLTLVSAKGIRKGCGVPAWFYLNLHMDPFITECSLGMGQKRMLSVGVFFILSLFFDCLCVKYTYKQ